MLARSVEVELQVPIYVWVTLELIQASRIQLHTYRLV